ncbi:MAG: hypothetical protein ACOYU2_06070 [Nitrospirota bacterium]
MIRFFIILAAIICFVSANSFASVFDDVVSKEKEREKKQQESLERESEKLTFEKDKKIIYNGHKLTFDNLIPVYELGEKLIRKTACLSYLGRKVEEKDISYFQELNESITPIGPLGAKAGEMLIMYYKYYAAGGVASGAYGRDILNICQKVSNSIGIHGLDCATCSGTWQYQTYQFQSVANGSIIRVTFTDTSGLVIDITTSTLSVFFPQMGYKIIYSIEGWEREMAAHQRGIQESSESISGWVNYRREKFSIDALKNSLVRFSVAEVNAPGVVNEVKRYLNADAQVSINTTYSIIDEIFQKEMERGVTDAIRFAVDIINPNKLTYLMDNYFKEKGVKK